MSITYCRAQEIFEDEIGRAILAGLELPSEIRMYPELQFNKRTKALGCCKWSGYKNGEKHNVKVYVSEYLLNGTEDDLRSTIAHELCHTCYGNGHGKEFKYWANKLNTRYGYSIARLANKEESKRFREELPEDTYKYFVKCPCCNHVWKYQKMCRVVKVPMFYTCRKCKTSLVRCNQMGVTK